MVDPWDFGFVPLAAALRARLRKAASPRSRGRVSFLGRKRQESSILWASLDGEQPVQRHSRKAPGMVPAHYDVSGCHNFGERTIIASVLHIRGRRMGPQRRLVCAFDRTYLENHDAAGSHRERLLHGRRQRRGSEGIIVL